MKKGIKIPTIYYYFNCIKIDYEKQRSHLINVASNLRVTFITFLSISSYFININFINVFQRT